MSPIIGDFVSGQSNVTYTRMRMLLAESGGGLQEGVVGATDLKGQQRAAGANMSIEAPPGACWVTVDTGTRNGVGHGFIDATQNPAVTASNATNPRIDQLVVRWNDTAIPTGTGGNIPTVEVITGTATATATLDNRLGVAALPNDCLRLADILVPATSTSVATANIRDRRPWARGASRFITGTSNSFNTTAFVALGVAVPIECSGAPMKLTLSGQMSVLTTLVNGNFSAGIDAVTQDNRVWQPPGTGVPYPFTQVWYIAPSAGRHTIDTYHSVTAATGSLAIANWTMHIEEIVRPNVDNT